MVGTNQLAEVETATSTVLLADDAAIIRDFPRGQSDAAQSGPSNEPDNQ
jgi:hypothetical protein